MDQAYLVEYLSSENSSSDFLGNTGVVLAGSVISDSVTLPAGADFLDVKILHGRSNSNFRHEDKGLANVHVDVATQTASGFVFFHNGRGDANTAAYSFSNYDLTSGLPILSSGATIVGDSTAAGANAVSYTHLTLPTILLV